MVLCLDKNSTQDDLHALLLPEKGKLRVLCEKNNRPPQDTYDEIVLYFSSYININAEQEEKEATTEIDQDKNHVFVTPQRPRREFENTRPPRKTNLGRETAANDRRRARVPKKPHF